METTKEGIIASAKPVTPSMSAVIVNSDFICFEVYKTGSIKIIRDSFEIKSLSKVMHNA